MVGLDPGLRGYDELSFVILPARMDRDKAAEHRLRGGANEARLRHHRLEQGRTREAADAFDEVAVAFLVVCNGLADLRDYQRRVAVVELREAGPIAGGELHAEETPAALQHAMCFAKGRRDVGDVPDAEHDRISVEASIGEAQLLGIFDLPAEAREAAPLGALLAHVKHVRIDVGDGDARAAPGDPECDVAGSTRHIENILAGTRLQARDEAVLPQPVHPARHEVVHQIVAASDRAEDLTDAMRLLFGADQLVAEIHLGSHAARGSSGLARRPPYRWRCRSFPKSKPLSAVWRRCFREDASSASRRGERIFGGRFRKISVNG